MNEDISHKLTPAEQADHDRSVHDYPDIQFSPSEYVVIDVVRSFFGLLRIWVIAMVAFVVLAATIFMIDYTSPTTINDTTMLALLICTFVLPMCGGLVGTYVYRKNYFVVTNERVFARIQYTPFAHRSQNVEIEHIEDCSYSQSGILPMLFNYGSIRLSTVGDEQTYLFTYVSNPAEQFKVVNRVVQQVDEGGTTKYHEPPRRQR